MSVYRRKGTAFWWVGFMKNGKRLQFSTGTTDETEAKQLELTVRRRLHGLPKDRFVAMVEGLIGDEGCPTIAATLIENLPDTWKQAYEDEGATLAEGTYKLRWRTCVRFAKWAAKTLGKGAFLDAATPEIAWQFITDCGGTAKTRQNTAGDLSAVWGTLIRRGLAKDNPWKYARPKGNAAEKRTGRAFTREEIGNILRVAAGTPWLFTAILVALYTGLRQGDVFALTWEMVDMKAGVIELTPSKTKRFKRRIAIPIHPDLKKHLETLQTCKYVIENVPSHPERAWQTTLKRAGIRSTDGTLLTFHNLRHTFATWVREAGADKGEQMLLGGWSEVATANRYDHDLTQLQSIIRRLPGMTD